LPFLSTGGRGMKTMLPHAYSIAAWHL
jgi:hypothetical protein